MISALVVSPAIPGAPALEADLESVGIHVLGAVACRNLVQEAVRQAPDVVVCWEPSPGDELFAALEGLAATDARPVVVFAVDPDAARIERAVSGPVHAYVVNGYALARLRPLIHLAQARFRKERELRAALDDVTHRFEERKLVDRAKGILMRATQMSEDEAFKVLRTASMHGNLRVGQVSRQVIDTAHYADAVNRSGQLRMLSQRIVKLYALLADSLDVAGTTALMGQSCDRVEDNLAVLGKVLSRPTFGDLISAVQSTWQQLKPELARPAQVARLSDIDASAGRLLQQAEQLTTVLESAGLASTLHVINVAGRQRMLSQRLAKHGLMASLLKGEAGTLARTAAEQDVWAFEQAQAFLWQLPLINPDIRADLEAASHDWQRMLAGLHKATHADARLLLASASESLLETSERLVQRYERSMQMLTG